ncbi:Ig-like domain-containing protein [Verminephrobacter eiseniae]|uniref:Ig-like domain-containing protein n=1 Tax=Verminephrobacter eiseniae TaxID=364317 RepID=UPI00223899AE|nr:Ig-like domain-containing protein [Verminephrobacter eiseniae]MCW5238187.1 hypothetical protein [Verminephrobacter eiseniae]
MATTITIDKQIIRNGETAQVTFTFSDPNHILSHEGLSVRGGLLGTFVNRGVIDGQRVYTAVFIPNGNEERSTHRFVYDVAGDADDAVSDYFTVDSRPPRIISASIAKSDLRPGEKTTITLIFTEPVLRNTFTLEDLRADAGKGTLSNLRVSPADTTATTTDATTWLVDLEAPSGPSTTSSDANQIQINHTGITDRVGNPGSDSVAKNGEITPWGTILSANYNIVAPPTVAITLSDTSLQVGETTPVTFTFSERVTGFDLNDVQYDTSKGTLSALTAVGTDGKVWSATYTPRPGIESAENTIRVNLTGVQGGRGNVGVGTGSSGNFSIDTLRPTVINVTISDNRLTAGETATITITFSERVAGFTKEAIDLSLANGTLGDLVPVGTDGKVWTVTFTPTASLARTNTNRLTLNLANGRDAAGNAFANNTYSLDQYTVDTMVFALSNATVNRSQLVLSYSDETALDGNADHAPTNESFTVLADGTRIDVSQVTVDAAARTVTLTLARAVAAGQQVTVAYQDTNPADNKALQEAGTGDDAASFAARPVTNLSPQPAPDTPDSGRNGAAPDSGRGGAAPKAFDSDHDGVPNAQEDQAPGLLRPDGSAGMEGDGNGDGIEDSQQVAVGSTRDLTLVAGSQDGKLIPDNDVRISELVRSEAPASLPKGMEMPLGLTQFKVGLAAGRSIESFSLYVDLALGVNGFWVEDSAGTWVNLASEPYGGKVSTEGGRTRLDFQIQNGGQYDTDGLADGNIAALGAAAKMPLSIVGQAPPQVESHGGFWF